MPIEIVKGNIFTSNCQTLVNTVNCVGVMGAGIALECRLRFPELYKQYLEHCRTGNLNVGKLWLFKRPNRWILNFPTKNDWKSPSKTDYLRSGLRNFSDTYEKREIQSIAFPILGADKGGLPKESSLRIMKEYLADLPVDIEIYEYDPLASDDLYPRVKQWINGNTDTHLAHLSGIRADFVRRIRDAMQREDIRQLNQLATVRGIGIKTMERLFAVAIERANQDPETSAVQGDLNLF